MSRFGRGGGGGGGGGGGRILQHHVGESEPSKASWVNFRK